MRKVLLILLAFAATIGLVMALGAVFLGRDNVYRVRRAQEIVDQLERLEIGKSGHTLADSIAAKFGSAPPPEGFGGRYNKENCAARDHLGDCSYIMLINDSPVETLFLKHRFLPRLGVPDWWGNAQIQMSSGTVESYSFGVWYRSSNGLWRGFGTGMSQALPRFEPHLADISDAYSVRRIDMKGEGEIDYSSGFGLASALTPAANVDERHRASHIDFSCLAQGCGEISDIMPDAWKDFHERLGHLNIE